MIGNDKKIKKILLDTSREEFLRRMIFCSETEKERCKKYLDLKGIAYHAVLANYVGIDNEGKVEYKKVQNLYVYDKRIRKILYKFISAFEEGIRAYISNHYNSLDKIKKLSRNIYKEVRDGSSVAKELENLDFNQLVQLVLNLKREDAMCLFNNNENYKYKLKAIRVLRNAVSHHRMLFVYEDFELCDENDLSSSSLIANIINLSNLINPFYRNFLIEEINNAVFDQDDPSFYQTIPQKAILNIVI